MSIQNASWSKCVKWIVAFVVLTFSVWLGGSQWLSQKADDSPFKVESVLNGLLLAESEATVRPGALVAIGFGSCLDHLANGISVLNKLGASPPALTKNLNELNNIFELETSFAYFFKNGASAGRVSKNSTFFKEVLQALLSIPGTRTAVGGNAPVMAKRFIEEGVDVVLGSHMSTALRSLLHPDIRVVGQSMEKQDTHLILEYEKDDTWGNYSAPRANRFILHNTVGSHQFSSLLEEFGHEMTVVQPSLFVVGGLRMMLNVDSEQVEGRGILDHLSELLSVVGSSTRIHCEMSSFPDDRQLSLIVDHVLRYADSIGLNEQELPRLRRFLEEGASTTATASENSNPSVAEILNDARAVYNALGQLSLGPNRFSRLHLHTLSFHAIIAKAGGFWPNGRAAIAKAALTSNRHTCGSRDIDINRARLMLNEVVDIGGRQSRQVRLSGRNPAVCWIETGDGHNDDIEVCIAPVLICRNVVQTVGGGDNVSAAGLVLQI